MLSTQYPQPFLQIPKDGDDSTLTMASLEYRLTIYDGIPSLNPHVTDAAEYIPSHPLQVHPTGNAFIVDSSATNLRLNLGLFSRLPDEIVAYTLEFLDVRETLSLGGSCKALYAFTTVDDIWRKFFEE
jgi:hypothetical protein